MFLKRLATLAAVAGLGLCCGCANTTTACNGGFFSRLCGRTRTTAAPCCDAGALPVTEGAALLETGPVFPTAPAPNCPCTQGVAPGVAPIVPVLPPETPPSSLPPGPAQRLVPQPQAQPVPLAP
jgi:hypothetical protein